MVAILRAMMLIYAKKISTSNYLMQVIMNARNVQKEHLTMVVITQRINLKQNVVLLENTSLLMRT